MTSAELTSAAAFGALFSEAAESHPDHDALVFGSRRVSYRELNRLVGAAADRIEPGDLPFLVRIPPVADHESFLDTVATILAAFSVGRPLTLLDAALPDERVRIVTEAARAEVPGCTVLMFTSGSTGTPKAVRQGPQLWRQQVVELRGELALEPGATLVTALPISFGGGLEVAVTALLTGAALVPVDPRDDGVDGLVATLREHAEAQLHLSPHLLRALSAHPDAPAALTGVRLASTCGEAPDAVDVAALRAAAPHISFLNRAGSSEAGHLAFDLYPPDRALPEGTLVPGRIADGKTLLVRDEDGRPVRDGEVGRIEVVSPFLSLGYLVDGAPVDFPLDDDGARHYVLGDLGAVDGGRLRLAGRSDDAVKIRGYLVDVSEVLAAARRVPDVVDATVIARKGPDDRADLVAYLVPAPGVRPPSVAAVRAELARGLPDWMQPTHVVLLSELPRTERGKIDRKALPAPAARPAHRSPRTRTERLLAPIWEDLLGVPEIGLDDDFTALGGDSLTAVDLLGRLTESFGTRLTLPEVTAAGTLQALAAVIDGADDTEAFAPEVAELSGPAAVGRPIVVAFAGAGESAHAFLPLARRLPDHRVVGISAHGLERRGIPDYTVGRAVRRAVRQVRALAPHGPYRFVGHSIGGIIAMETARRLEADGETVDRVVCLDTVLDDALRRGSPICFPAPEGVRDTETPPDDVVGQTTAQKWRTRAELLSAGWWPRPAARQWALFHDLGRRTAVLHRLRPWDGPVTVVLAEGNDDPEQWWSLVAPRVRGVHRVSGDHTAMLRPPFVAVTADLVARALDPSLPE
ncbi:MAG: AMP-binding protein [Gordonia sp. (in: high G+C Gram-positive bacteria)]|uniref:AMP-binding protein n=1 Tax=Gordonia sp. (in: high G+C Gram-positive bacteria) TaxID=84139 RepID=UPI0039E52C45